MRLWYEAARTDQSRVLADHGLKTGIVGASHPTYPRHKESIQIQANHRVKRHRLCKFAAAMNPMSVRPKTLTKIENE